MCVFSYTFGYVIILVVTSMVFFIFTNLYRSFSTSARLKEVVGALRIVEITNTKDCHQACQDLISHCAELSALGFDCEWVNRLGVQRPVALLQLASVQGLCCLFRLNQMGFIPPELQALLQNRDILKLGVEPLYDSELLKKDYNVQIHSTLDLRHLYQTPSGLQYLVKHVLGQTIDKRKSVQCSNWEIKELSNNQKLYAAKDAFVAVEIFQKWLHQNTSSLENTKKNMLTEQIKSEITKFLDVKYIYHNENHTPENILGKLEYNKKYDSNETKNSATRKAPLYDNCYMYSQTGQLLCSCDKKKADWYLNKRLAEVFSTEPFSIKLRFETDFQYSEEQKYDQQLKQNRCVVCGSTEATLRHYVVPKEYRKYFPDNLKDHKTHDILLMCLNCHFLASEHNTALKHKLANLCQAPFNVQVPELKEIQKLKSSAQQLIKDKGDHLPPAKKLALQKILKDYYNVEKITMDLLLKAQDLDTKNIKESHSHGAKVVEYFKSNETLHLLIFLWRVHFINNMKPQHLPMFWSESHDIGEISDEYKKKYQQIISLTES